MKNSNIFGLVSSNYQFTSSYLYQLDRVAQRLNQLDSYNLTIVNNIFDNIWMTRNKKLKEHVDIPVNDILRRSYQNTNSFMDTQNHVGENKYDDKSRKVKGDINGMNFTRPKAIRTIKMGICIPLQGS